MIASWFSTEPPLTSQKEGAYADVVVKLGRIILLKKTFDICEEA